MDSRPRLHGGRLYAGITGGWIPAAAGIAKGVWGGRGLVGGVGEAEVYGQVVAD